MARVVAPVIRPVDIADLSDLVALEREIYPEPWSEQVFRDELGQANRIYLAAADDAGLVAYGGVMMVGEDAHVTTLAVAPRARRSRLGTRLLLELVEAALAAGARHLTLGVRISNDPARSLYQRFGFAPVGLRKNYYRSEDALVMWVIDVDQPEYRERLDGIRTELFGEELQ